MGPPRNTSKPFSVWHHTRAWPPRRTARSSSCAATTFPRRCAHSSRPVSRTKPNGRERFDGRRSTLIRHRRSTGIAPSAPASRRGAGTWSVTERFLANAGDHGYVPETRLIRGDPTTTASRLGKREEPDYEPLDRARRHDSCALGVLELRRRPVRSVGRERRRPQETRGTEGERRSVHGEGAREDEDRLSRRRAEHDPRRATLRGVHSQGSDRRAHSCGYSDRPAEQDRLRLHGRRVGAGSHRGLLDRASRECARDAAPTPTAAAHGIVDERIYRACLSALGWRRPLGGFEASSRDVLSPATTHDLTRGGPAMADPTSVLLTARLELARLPAVLDGLLGDLDPADWRARPVAPEWAPIEIVCHLRDEEVEDFGARVRVALEGGS